MALPALAFTVLTPTHNRASVITRTFESLLDQGDHLLEWLVVDDGSSDDTAAVIAACAARVNFPVRYVRQDHGHKKAAFNRGVRLAQGELLVVLDDDDTLAPDALNRLWSIWQAMPATQRTTCLGIVGLCARENGHIVGDRFPHDVMDATATDMFFVHGVRGEKFGCQRTDVLRQYPYPEDISGFVPESLVWWAMAAQGWQIRFVNIVLRTYHQTTVSLSTSPGDGSRHAVGLYLLNWSWIEQQWRYARYAPGAFLLAAARLTRFARGARRAGHGGVLQRYPVTHRAGRLAVALMAPLGWIMAWRDRLRR